MNAVTTQPAPLLGLSRPMPIPVGPMDTLLSASGPAFMGVFAPDGEFPELSVLRGHIARAEAFLDGCEAHAAALREAAEPVPVDEIGPALGLFVTAWPNASGADLAGYGAQLAEDVIERRPCCHALRTALRRLRQTSRFLPAIAEVLGALDAAQARVRDTAWHLEQLPAELDKARRALVSADQRAGRPEEARSA